MPIRCSVEIPVLTPEIRRQFAVDATRWREITVDRNRFISKLLSGHGIPPIDAKPLFMN